LKDDDVLASTATLFVVVSLIQIGDSPSMESNVVALHDQVVEVETKEGATRKVLPFVYIVQEMS